MPFDPDDLDGFRKLLNMLANNHRLSTGKILIIMRQNRKITDPPFTMGRSTLARFKKGADIREIEQLEEIWNTLRAHKTYGRFFPKETEIAQINASEQLQTSMLAGFFSDGGPASSYNLGALGEKIAGQYVMYRPAWRRATSGNIALASRVDIDAVEKGFTLSETQEMPKTDNEPDYRQHDSGYIAAFRNHIYFLMKEEPPGTTVKWGVVNVIFPNTPGSKVNWFRGYLFVTSTVHIYPLAKFFCRRLDDVKSPRFGYMKNEDIPDDDARAYLQEILRLPS